MEENQMRIYFKHSKPIRILLFICLSSLVLTSLVGFRDIKQEGVECKFRARIVDIEKPPPDHKVLVVKQIRDSQATAKEKRENIYVLVTRDTQIGSQSSLMKFEDLQPNMSIEVRGLKVIEKQDEKEYTVVFAKSIRSIIE